MWGEKCVMMGRGGVERIHKTYITFPILSSTDVCCSCVDAEDASPWLPKLSTIIVVTVAPKIPSAPLKPVPNMTSPYAALSNPFVEEVAAKA